MDRWDDFGGFWAYDIHEGVDYVSYKVSPPIFAAADGTVVYASIGCPQSTTARQTRSRNNSGRLCAGGWGNHVVIQHANGLYTRYAHLAPGGISVDVGQSVSSGQRIATMGNSGSSEIQHLHFEVGVKSGGFNKRAASQNFDRVYNPEYLPYGKAPTQGSGSKAGAVQKQCTISAGGDSTTNVRSGAGSSNSALGQISKGKSVKVRGWVGDWASIEGTLNSGKKVGAPSVPAFIHLSQLNLSSCK